MLFNSGTLIFVYILAGSLGMLLLFVILLAVTSKRNPNGNKALKAFSLIFAITSLVASILTPLAYYNYLPVNIRYGTYISVDNSNTYLNFHRDSVEIHENGSSEGKKATWSMENNILKLTYNSVSIELSVQDVATKLYSGDTLMFKYMKN